MYEIEVLLQIINKIGSIKWKKIHMVKFIKKLSEFYVYFNVFFHQI